ncbi:MAG: hypothetical protein E2O84_08455 [Bacteroidetes bacterium]|nr:MAG: hypothetical protein E2O84_08455 [Bacteroidota bacterium]
MCCVLLLNSDGWSQSDFIRGDVNCDGVVDPLDNAVLQAFVFGGGSLACRDAADLNDDGVISVTDLTYLISFTSGGGAAPMAPYPGCGPDPTADALTCASMCCVATGCLISDPGDVNGDALVTSSDIIALVNFVFKGGSGPIPCVAAGDINCNGAVTSADIIALVAYVFKGGTPPCDPCTIIPAVWSCP